MTKNKWSECTMSNIQSNYFNGFLNSSFFFFLTGSQKIFTVHPSFMEISSLKSGVFKVFFNPVSNFFDHYFILTSNCFFGAYKSIEITIMGFQSHWSWCGDLISLGKDLEMIWRLDWLSWILTWNISLLYCSWLAFVDSYKH